MKRLVCMFMATAALCLSVPAFSDSYEEPPPAPGEVDPLCGGGYKAPPDPELQRFYGYKIDLLWWMRR